MSDIQDKLNEILNNPEAMKQVQSLGEQLGISVPSSASNQQSAPSPKPAPPPAVVQPQSNNMLNPDMLSMVSRIAPLMNSFKGDDNATRLLHSLRPFLSNERQVRLDKAEKMLKLIRLMPMLRDNGFF